MLWAILLCFSHASFAASTPVTKANIQQKAELDTQQLKTLWKNYQNHIQQMNRALPALKQQKDVQQKNAMISQYNRYLEQTKNSLSLLILSQTSAVQLRQQLTEHATKYQNVYKLAAVENMSEHQLNAWQRLSTQTENLYQTLQSTAQSIY
jgi:hypothetical protein